MASEGQTADTRMYYALPWEHYWLERIDSEGCPVDIKYRLRMDAALDMVKPKSATFRAVDVGCGIGIYAVNLLQRFPEASVLGADVSPAQIDTARELSGRLGLTGRASFTVADVSSPDLALTLGTGFDVVLCTEVIEHFEDPGPLIRNLRSLCAPAGRIVLSVPLARRPLESYYFYRQRRDGAWFETQDRTRLDPTIEAHRYYHRTYGPHDFLRLCRTSGLRAVSIRHCRFAYPRTKSLADRALARIAGLLDSGVFSRLSSDLSLRDRLKNAVSLNRLSENLVVSATSG